MAIEGLTIIGESINDSVPSTNRLYEAGDIEGILGLAKLQDEKGAGFIDVNVGGRSPEFMAEMVQKVQSVTAKPLSIDTPDMDIARAGLAAYDLDRAGGAWPILNSVSPVRMEMFELFDICPFRPILLASEQVVSGEMALCHTAEETYRAAKTLIATFLDRCEKASIDDCIIDPGISPIGTDMDGNLKRLLAGMQMIHDDADMKGFHASVGLSNFTVMLPPKRADGGRVKGPLESAFLTLAMPLGLDMVIGSVKRRYELLSDDDPALICIKECLEMEQMDVPMKIIEFTS